MMTNFIRATAVFCWMCLKALPIVCVPGFTRLVADQDKEIAEMYGNVATIRRLLKNEGEPS